MHCIHEHPEWPEFQWDMRTLAEPLASLRHKQGFLLGRMQGMGFTLCGEAGLETLTTDIVKSSAIEGENINPAQVRSSLARRLGIDIGGLSPVSRYVEGITEMMLNATQRYMAPLTEERLFGWHTALFSPSRQSNHITVGAWRSPASGRMQVISGYIGHETVHFEAPAAERLAAEMARFLNWFNAPSSHDPVLKAGIAHLWFVTIHPFEDGNGRIGRAIADLALARADNCPQRFYSMSAQIERERNDYYAILEKSQKGGMDITPWLNWFLGCLGRSIENAEETLANVLRKSTVWRVVGQHPVNQRQRTVISRLLDDFKGDLTSSKYAKLAKCSQDTALRDIRELVEYGLLRRSESGGRSTKYTLQEKVFISTTN